MDPMDYWRLCAELSVVQAALLLAGCDPASREGDNCEALNTPYRPQGYEAAKNAIVHALRQEAVSGRIERQYEFDADSNQVYEIPESVDVKKSTVVVDSLRAWLKSRGIKSGFFFPDDAPAPDYMSPEHPRYSAKLAAAVKVWQAMDDKNLYSGKSPKEGMSTWLESRYKELGLVWNGKINKTGIEEITKVANWITAGGAPTTPGDE